LIIGTEEFDKFIINNDLHDFAETEILDKKIKERFLASELSTELADGLRRYLKSVKTPLAVRSSSLLEDSHNQPFAGIYSTYFLPNNHQDDEMRLGQLFHAVKLVYASSFFRSAKSYIQATLHKAEEEKMGVIVQRLVGNEYNDKFYPLCSGVIQSNNFYPLPPLDRNEPIASIALGLGKIVVEGGHVVSFSPYHPNAIPGFSSTEDILNNSQKRFYSLDLYKKNIQLFTAEDATIISNEILEAEKDGTLEYIASVYDPIDDRLRDGIDHEGMRVIMFAQMLKYDLYPITQILEQLVALGQKGMGCPVEMEFAVAFDENKDLDLYVLQIRPLLSTREYKHFEISADLKMEDAIVYSTKAMGNIMLDNIKDIIYVPASTFDRTKTIEISQEIGQLNKKLVKTPYILLGPGRWGSNDRFLGVPVDWDQISRVKTMVETPIEDIRVEPSHGSHFFHNVTSLGIPYLTIIHGNKNDYVDWTWLEDKEPVEELKYIRHIKLDKTLVVKVDGQSGTGVILKENENDNQTL
jgi:hypothetical protein